MFFFYCNNEKIIREASICFYNAKKVGNPCSSVSSLLTGSITFNSLLNGCDIVATGIQKFICLYFSERQSERRMARPRLHERKPAIRPVYEFRARPPSSGHRLQDRVARAQHHRRQLAGDVASQDRQR